MNIPVILGTARTGRQSEKVATWMLSRVEESGAETELIDVRDYRLPASDNSEQSDIAKKYIEKIVAADGLVIVSPEYNHGYPGELKMLLDLCFKQYGGRPVLLCGVSSGGLGGARVVEQLNQVMTALGMYPIPGPLYFSDVEQLFDDSGQARNESHTKRAQKSLGRLIKYAQALQTAR